MNTEGLIKIGVAGVAGYYVMGKKPIGALVGIAVLILLVKSGQASMMQTIMQAEPSMSEPTTGAPLSGGIPAPGTTQDPMDGTMEPGKRIGLLR